MELWKYQGAGNDFLLVDNRDGGFTPDTATIASLCDRHYGVGADGIMLLESDPNYDFRMVYYNSDGSGGMMCGNGGRCIVAFAAEFGIIPKNGKTYEFIADDGPHSAEILDGSTAVTLDFKSSLEGGSSQENKPLPNGTETMCKTVRLKMKDVKEVKRVDAKSFFLDTGTRHFVRFVSGLQSYDVFNEGRRIRNLPQFAPIGTNANFVEATSDRLNVRTFEKGVEDETFACGTGITASAIAFAHYVAPTAGTPFGQTSRGKSNEREDNSAPANSEKTAIGDRVHINVKALRDFLAVDFIKTAEGAEDVWLTGPATFVCKIVI